MFHYFRFTHDPLGLAIGRAVGESRQVISATFAPRSSPRGFLQANTLVAVIGHAQVAALVIRELEVNGLNWFATRIEYNKKVPLTGIKPVDFKALPLRPVFRWPPVDSDLKPVGVYLAIWKSRRFFPKRIIDPRCNADAARALLRRTGNRNHENERNRQKSSFHDVSR